MRKQSAFTLIELLVVIAIIAILAAILFPVFASARAQARKATCISNLKQIALSAAMYGEDYDARLLPGWTQRSSDLTQADYTWTWAGLIQPYQKNYAVNQCPDHGTIAPTTAKDASAAMGFKSSYGMNVDGIFGAGNTQVFPNVLGQWPKKSTARNSAETVQFMDAAEITDTTEGDAAGMKSAYLNFLNDPDKQNPGAQNYPAGLYFRIPTSIGDGSNGAVVPISRHNGNCVAAYLDGHAKAIKLTSVWVKAGQSVGAWWHDVSKQPFRIDFPTP